MMYVAVVRILDEGVLKTSTKLSVCVVEASWACRALEKQSRANHVQMRNDLTQHATFSLSLQ